ncbi:MAG: TrmB family transcriptional regulator [Candidatus Bathyarchaeia archaeon]
MNLQDQIETLTRLGLTNNQAKIYLTCIEHDSLTAGEISKSAGIAPEVVYRTIPNLQKIGLITKAVAFPTEFEPTPIDTGIDILLGRKDKENSDVHAKATELLRQIGRRRKRRSIQEFRIVLVSGKERLVQFVGKKMGSVQKSLDVIGTSQKLPGWMNTYLAEIKKLLAKRVEIRFAIEWQEEMSRKGILSGLPKSDNLKVKFITKELRTCLIILDNTEVLIGTSPRIAFSHAPIYWSNNLGIVDLCRTYFERHWRNIRS